MQELQAVDQAINIVEKYIEKSKNTPTKEVERVIASIENKFDISPKKLEKIAEILSKANPKNAPKKELTVDEADMLLLKGLFMKAGMRMSKNLKDAVDFDNNKIDFDRFLKALKARKRRLEKISRN